MPQATITLLIAYAPTISCSFIVTNKGIAARKSVPCDQIANYLLTAIISKASLDLTFQISVSKWNVPIRIAGCTHTQKILYALEVATDISQLSPE